MQSKKAVDWGGADTIVFVTGKGAEERTVYWVSVALQLYLFDVELPETIVIMTNDKLLFLGSSSKVTKLNFLETYAEKPSRPALEFLVLDRGNQKAQFAQIIQVIRQSGKKVGCIARDAQATHQSRSLSSFGSR